VCFSLSSPSLFLSLSSEEGDDDVICVCVVVYIESCASSTGSGRLALGVCMLFGLCNRILKLEFLRERRRGRGELGAGGMCAVNWNDDVLMGLGPYALGGVFS